MGQDDRCGIDRQGLLDDLAWVHTGAIDRATKKFVKAEHAVPIIQIQAAKHLVSEMPDFGAQKRLCISRATNGLAHGKRRLKVASGELGQGSDHGGT